MNSIYKYQLTLQDKPIELTMPQGARILHIGLQHEQVCMWVLVNTSEELVEVTRVIKMYGTGWPIREELGAHIDTVLTAGGQFVWHFFDGGEKDD